MKFSQDHYSQFLLKSSRSGQVYRPALVGIGICLVLVVLFSLVAWQALQNEGVNDFDTSWARDMRECSGKRPFLRDMMVVATHMGGIPFMGGMAAIGTYWQFRRNQRDLAVAWCCIALGGGGLNVLLKEIFDRPRPPEEWRDPVVSEINESFPSGHSMGSAIGYGLLGYMAVRRNWSRRRTIVILTFLVLLVPVIGFSRIYLRAHWFTDVAGGLIIGGAWLALCLGWLETWRLRKVGSAVRTEPSK